MAPVTYKLTANKLLDDLALNHLALRPDSVLKHLYLWQCVTYLFLHADIFHLLFNMLGLWFLGCDLETIWGEEKFLKYTGIEEGEHVSIRINEWKFCEDIFMKGDIGLGESYISGYWDCGNINNLIKFGIENYNELERVIKGSLLKILFLNLILSTFSLVSFFHPPP
mgnify:CR=1 FL=1